MSKMSKAIAALGVVAGLGVAALPLSSYAVGDTATTTAQAIVGDSIVITVHDATVIMNNVMANQEAKEASTDIMVQTNNVAGYQVQIKDSDTETALKITDGSGTASGIAAGIPTKGTNAWGFKASTTSGNVNVGSSSAYRAVSSGNQILAEGTTASAKDGDTITLTFGVTVDTTIAAGTYSDEVTLTASTKQSSDYCKPPQSRGGFFDKTFCLIVVIVVFLV